MKERNKLNKTEGKQNKLSKGKHEGIKVKLFLCLTN
jgi:hypothetical protein